MFSILQWLETIVSAALRKRSGQERHKINTKFGLPSPQPLICFALCTGAASDPMVKTETLQLLLSFKGQ